MDGLECSEILLSKLEFTKRLDAEYYRKVFLKYELTIASRANKLMGEISEFLIGPFGSAYNTENYLDYSPYRYIRGQDVKPFILKDADPKYISGSDYKRLHKYALREKDIMISVVGTLGNACIVREKDIPAIFSCKSTVVRPGKVRPDYLVAYLNSKYGQQLLLRKERGAIQKGLNLDDLKNLPVPIFSEKLETAIANNLTKANMMLDTAKKLYSQISQLLLDELGMTDFIPAAETVSIKSFSESFSSTGRIDAEYYQPKYDEYFSAVKNYFNGYELIRDVFDIVKTKCGRTFDSYPYIEIGDIDTNTGTAYSNIVPKEELPDNAKVMTKPGDILVSTVRPNRGAVAIIDAEGLLVSGAFTVLRQKGSYSKEVLQILLRTPLYCDWLLRYNVGTSYPVIKDEDVLNMPIPVFSADLQQAIVKKAGQSISLRHDSEQLLYYAKQAVEIAIEQGEEKAMEWLKEKGVEG